MSITENLLSNLPGRPVPVHDVRIGPFWTLVWTAAGAGLASTMHEQHALHGKPVITGAGDLLTHSAQELAQLLRSNSVMERALGMAAVNALLSIDEGRLTERNASEEICLRGVNKRVVVVGHFPFLPDVKRRVGKLDVLELTPGPGDLPAEAAEEVIPEADVVAITVTSLVNGTFDQLIALCAPQAYVLVLGPTTPLSPCLFDHGVDLVAGTLVTDPESAARSACQGAIFTQMRGVRLVTMVKDERQRR